MDISQKIGFDRIRAQVAALCTTQAAAERVDAEGFSTDAEQVSWRLSVCDELRTVLMMESGFVSEEFVDTSKLTAKIALEGAFLEVEQIMDLRRALAIVQSLIHFFRERQKYENLYRLTQGVESFPEIINHIDSILDRYGKIKDSASGELYTIRRSIRDREGQASKRLQQVLTQAQKAGIVESDAAISIRDGRAVIPVAAAHKRKLSGFIHDESATGKTFYIEPVEVVEINNELKELEYAERREIVRILTEFTEMLRPDAEAIAASGEYLTTMDMIRAKARFAISNSCVKPIISYSDELILRNARHPLLAQALAREGKSVVPLNMRLDHRKRILLISGPNAGGKSVCLKTVGLLQYMFQCGYLIPASENSEMMLFDRLYIDIGDEQSIENDLSTYSSHLLNMKNMLNNATDRSLILIDEFGTGTEPVIGGAIAESILEKLESKGCFGVITTHYSNLKYYASNAEGITNGGMTFDVQNIKPLFSLEMGTPGSSFAVEIARKIGLAEDLIKRASEKAGSDHINIERLLRQISRDKHYWEQKRDRIRVTERKVEELEARYAADLARIKQERSAIIKSAKTEAQRLVDEANKQIEGTIRAIKESQADREKTRFARKNLDTFKEEALSEDSLNNSTQQLDIERQMERVRERQRRREERKNQRGEASSDSAISPPKPVKREIEVGSKVRIADQETIGEVLSIKGKKVVVGFGQIITTLDVGKLSVVSNSEYKKQNRSARSTINISSEVSERRLNFKQNIDVRGMRASEALEAVQDFIDDALMVGVNEVRILHGKGTGALMTEIRRYLKSVPLVESTQDEHVELGGSGITVVKFEQ